MKKIVIIGAGNLGLSLAQGIEEKNLAKGKLTLTRRVGSVFSREEKRKYNCTNDNILAVKNADIIIIAVRPTQCEEVVKQIASSLNKNQLLISVVTGKSIEKIKGFLGDAGNKLPIVRAMPNTSLQTGNSMTFLAFNKEAESFKSEVQAIFNGLGKTLIIEEKMFPQATVLGGSGIAIMARFIRVYMQAGIQNGFSEEHSLTIATQVMKGAAILLEQSKKHPEIVIDGVTTPGGCTIDTLVEMEHGGFSSALLKAIGCGITKAGTL